MTSPYVGRLAPSPTGDLHLGHVRTFAIAWLRARQSGGLIRFRVEDLDPPREVHGSTERIIADLKWLGFDWDGPIVRQSERDDAYERALAELEAAGRTFRCRCTRKEIAAVASAPHGAEELGPRYPGTCRDGVKGNGTYSVRFAHGDETIQFTDAFVGEVDGSAWLDDFVLRRKDRLWAYQFAVVVDDAASGVTEVVRGDDLLSSTPRQIALYQALGLSVPTFVHVPLVLDQNGERLSKRSQSLAVRTLREGGSKASDVVAQLGRSLGVAGEHRSLRSMLNDFSLDRVPRTAVRL